LPNAPGESPIGQTEQVVNYLTDWATKLLQWALLWRAQSSPTSSERQVFIDEEKRCMRWVKFAQNEFAKNRCKEAVNSLGRCWMGPDASYPRYTFVGPMTKAELEGAP
jgi:hypothetical protein